MTTPVVEGEGRLTGGGHQIRADGGGGDAWSHDPL